MLKKVHIPTSRVAFEDVLTMLIDDFGVNAKRGASTGLAMNRAKFEKWHDGTWALSDRAPRSLNRTFKQAAAG